MVRAAGACGSVACAGAMSRNSSDAKATDDSLVMRADSAESGTERYRFARGRFRGPGNTRPFDGADGPHDQWPVRHGATRVSLGSSQAPVRSSTMKSTLLAAAVAVLLLSPGANAR